MKKKKSGWRSNDLLIRTKSPEYLVSIHILLAWMSEEGLLLLACQSPHAALPVEQVYD